ncbi:hypothetical protein [Zavarzinia sp. CC-PAN008]|uniref:LVIVD repeat-containing protein n=1 Tax=Zavarzinia sp. CC-PAN008 TaxID=3243332 RepID=UPI003F7453CB
MRALLLSFGFALSLLAHTGGALAAGGESARSVTYAETPPAPYGQSMAEAERKSAGCVSCHTATDAPTMHVNPVVVLGCTDCHGGDATVAGPALANQVPGVPGHGATSGSSSGATDGSAHAPRRYGPEYRDAMDRAHVLARYPNTWHEPSSATPPRTYTLLNREAPEYIRFVNPSDYRVAREACGACHMPTIVAAERSLMATGAMLWGGASYNNGILPFKNYILGEAYTREGIGANVVNPVEPDEKMKRRGVLAVLYVMPAWEVIPVGDIFRVFERGGRNIITQFPEIGIPSNTGAIQRLEEPGRPDIRQSNRASGTGLRIAVPVINIHKTRLNDPFTWFMGTNDQPGDFRSSGCSACHVVYANDRQPEHSGPYAEFGHWGESQQADPTIPRGEPGHPLKHAFTSAIPTSQCMICHMHQPNIFLNTYLGYTMWDYESDAPSMWPKEQHFPSNAEMFQSLNRNPEEAVVRGLWRDVNFLSKVYELNPTLQTTQFADYHGHGWNFRAIFSRDLEGNLLDGEGKIVSNDDPDKFEKAVHLADIHVDYGMQCMDCHFAQDSHGNGHLYGEVANAIEIGCKDCHGTSQAYPTLRTSGPAAKPGGNNLAAMRVADGRARFEWRGNELYQRSSVFPGLEWRMTLVKDTVNPSSADYNAKAARAKLMSNDGSMRWGPGVAAADLAHKDEEMLCFTCHLSWSTSCGGCHLPIQANWKTERHHYEGGETRNFATYNPQVARDDVFQLGVHASGKSLAHNPTPECVADPLKCGVVTPIRSTSALVLSSTNINRERIYIQQAPIAASGYSSQAFAPHFPHTVRVQETKTCTNCHLSDKGDNNALMAQLMTLGTNYFNFVGYNAWFGGDGGVIAQEVTEWDEPQAVIGSYLHRYAYPQWYAEHQARGRELKFDTSARGQFTHTAGRANCVQLRGEYLYVAEGSSGFRVYDVQAIANKGFSERIITAPFSPLGHDSHVASENATCVALSTSQPISPLRNDANRAAHPDNLEQKMHELYRYAVVVDSVEGLILVDIDTMANGEARDNFLSRAVTWNENGVLNGASHVSIAGVYVYVATPKGLVVLNLDNPLQPRYVTTIDLPGVTSSNVQFRYLFATTPRGLEVVDVTRQEQPRIVPGAVVPLRQANRVYVARTYAYVAAGADGLAIIDVKRPEMPRLDQMFNADGRLNDARDVTIGATNASLFAYVADGVNGMKVVQLIAPDTQPNFYGFAPRPVPELIAWAPTPYPTLAVSEGLERDRGVDESGHQVAVYGRLGSRPFTRAEMERFFLRPDGSPMLVTDEVRMQDFVPGTVAEPAPVVTEPGTEPLVPEGESGQPLRRRTGEQRAAR